MYVKRFGPPGDLPTIVLEAGAGATSASWGWAQKRMAERTQVVSYDRAGLGKSDVRPEDITADAVASRLDALLSTLELTPPYIFVGHSLGGLLVRYYAARHAEKTAALVLVDPPPADRSLLPRGHDRFAPLYYVLLRLIQGFARTGAFRMLNPFARFARRSGLPAREAADVIAALASSRHLDTVIRELKGMAAVQDLVNRCPVPKNIPLMVVSAGTRPRSPELGGNAEAQFYAAVLHDHAETAKRSTFGRHIIIQDADHNTLLTRQSYADELADHVLRFAEDCRLGMARGAPSLPSM